MNCGKVRAPAARSSEVTRDVGSCTFSCGALDGVSVHCRPSFRSAGGACLDCGGRSGSCVFRGRRGHGRRRCKRASSTGDHRGRITPRSQTDCIGLSEADSRRCRSLIRRKMALPSRGNEMRAAKPLQSRRSSRARVSRFVIVRPRSPASPANRKRSRRWT
jgi:hypothetical protein